MQSGDVPITDKAVQVFARKCGIRMNVLFYEGKRNQRFVAPEKMWKTIIKSVHWVDLHPGLSANMKSIKRYWAWTHMFEMIEIYVKFYVNYIRLGIIDLY